MLSIVSATDFSDISDNATHYACKLAIALKAKLTVLHSYMIPVSFTDNPMPVMPIDEGRRIAEDQMNKLLAALKSSYPELEIDSAVTYGDVISSIKEYISGHETWMVIVGNSSEEGTGFLLGNNLIAELKSLSCTVMAVPPDYTYNNVQKICLACDFKNVGEHLPATDILNIVNSCGAELHVLNIDHENKQFGTSVPLESSSLHEMLKPANPTYHYTDNANIEEGIEQFVSENSMDWLIVTPHKRGFFEGLFHKSHTKQIVKKVHIPVIAVHEK